MKIKTKKQQNDQNDPVTYNDIAVVTDGLAFPNAIPKFSSDSSIIYDSGLKITPEKVFGTRDSNVFYLDNTLLLNDSRNNIYMSDDDGPFALDVSNYAVFFLDNSAVGTVITIANPFEPDANKIIITGFIIQRRVSTQGASIDWSSLGNIIWEGNAEPVFSIDNGLMDIIEIEYRHEDGGEPIIFGYVHDIGVVTE